MDRLVLARPKEPAEGPPVGMARLLPPSMKAQRVPRVDVVADIPPASSADGCKEVDIKKQMKVIQLRLIQLVEVGREKADPSPAEPQDGGLAEDKVCAVALKAVGLSEKPVGAPAEAEARAVAKPRPHKAAVGRDTAAQADRRVAPAVVGQADPKLMVVDGQRQTAALPI